MPERLTISRDLFRFVEQRHEMIDSFELVETSHVLRTDGALPDRSGRSHQQLFIVSLTDQLVERVEPAILEY